MTDRAKKLIASMMVWAHHLACGLTGAFAFGVVAYLLDIGGVRTTDVAASGFDHPVVMGGIALVGVFAAVDRLLQNLLGGPGSL